MANKATQPRVYISQRGGRKKLHKNKYVYLKNGDDFDIEIVNPTKETVMAKIELNGNLISNSGLVVKPGERFVLQRFIDDNKKFVFNTYEIDGSDSELVEAISNNGMLKVFFYKEQQINQYCNPCVWINPYVYPFNQQPYDYPNHTGSPYWYNNPTITCSNTQNNDLNFNTFYSSTETYGGGATGSTFTTSNFCSNTGHTLKDLGFDQIFTDKLEDNVNELNSLSDEVSLETGRVEKGGSTNQSFEYVNMDFESTISYTTEIQILPDSRKPINKTELNKTFCHKCGRKAKNKENFCSNCGTELHK